MVKLTLPGGATESTRKMRLLIAVIASSPPSFGVSKSSEPAAGKCSVSGTARSGPPAMARRGSLGSLPANCASFTSSCPNFTQLRNAASGVQSAQPGWSHAGNSVSAAAAAPRNFATSGGTAWFHAVRSVCHCCLKSCSSTVSWTVCFCFTSVSAACLEACKSATASRSSCSRFWIWRTCRRSHFSYSRCTRASISSGPLDRPWMASFVTVFQRSFRSVSVWS